MGHLSGNDKGISWCRSVTPAVKGEMAYILQGAEMHIINGTPHGMITAADQAPGVVMEARDEEEEEEEEE